MAESELSAAPSGVSLICPNRLALLYFVSALHTTAPCETLPATGLAVWAAPSPRKQIPGSQFLPTANLEVQVSERDC